MKRALFVLAVPSLVFAQVNWGQIQQIVDFWGMAGHTRAEMNDYLVLSDKGQADEGVKHLIDSCGENPQCKGQIRAAFGESRAKLVQMMRAKLYPPPPPPRPPVDEAYEGISWAWKQTGPCSQFLLCATYFDDFGVNITFSDGSVAPFAHVQRLTTSGRDCIDNALANLKQGNRGLAVEWVMASQIHNKPYMEFLRTHPDAVIAALRKFKP